jgi:hypothetical protein
MTMILSDDSSSSMFQKDRDWFVLDSAVQFFKKEEMMRSQIFIREIDA